MAGSAAADRSADLACPPRVGAQPRLDPAAVDSAAPAGPAEPLPAGPAACAPPAPLPPSAVNLANTLTLFRLLLVPVFVLVLMHHGGRDSGWRIWACAIFAAACITDSVDGTLARRRNAITDIGKIADPIADKALIGAALIGLAALKLMSWWIVAVILIR
ncbi:MAG: CDP-alcohol phosphatidyltransferase family protein, partial [Frankiaceae bacterium]|nr:CDP-alcohol phosphatidyltransferase family protein [Frankiaceae bacterium]